MPTYEYEAVDPARSCPRCAAGFETVRSIRDAPLDACPACGAAVRKREDTHRMADANKAFAHFAWGR